jgi:hypothetical protein
MLRTNVIVVLIVGLLSIVSAARAEPITIVAPSGSEDTDGNVNYLPFGFSFPNSPPPDFPPWPEPRDGFRGQELYPASAFESLGPGQLITSLAWRPDISVYDDVRTEWENLTLNLSTTTREAGSLSTTFADNYGNGGFTEVFSGTMEFETDGIPRGEGLPHEFDYVVEFDTPYFYDPREGNLLVEVIATFGEGSPWIWMDGVFGTEDSGMVFALSADAEEDAIPLPGIDIMQFTAISAPPGIVGNPGLKGHIPPGLKDGLPPNSRAGYAVPEPTSAALLLLGCGICCLVQRRQRANAR